jgi:hypothetical protein
MIDRHGWCRVLLRVGAALWPLWLSGCARPVSALEFTSHKGASSPETYRLALDECAYYVGPGGDYYIGGRATHTAGEGRGGSIVQLLEVHLFWKPWPGKTFDDSSSIDATIRYAIVTERGTVTYSGTGFVYPRKRWLGNELIVDVEVARLRLESRQGDSPDLFGAARLAGTLVAKENASLAVDLRRQLELQGGPRKPA